MSFPCGFGFVVQQLGYHAIIIANNNENGADTRNLLRAPTPLLKILVIPYFRGYFSVSDFTIARALSAAGSPSLIIMAIASAI